MPSIRFAPTQRLFAVFLAISFLAAVALVWPLLARMDDADAGGHSLILNSRAGATMLVRSANGPFQFSDDDLRIVPRALVERVSRSEHGLLGAEKAGQAYHSNVGAWVPRFERCDPCTDDCAGRHLAYFDLIGSSGILATADAELRRRREFYLSPNWSDPDVVRQSPLVVSNASRDMGEAMFRDLFGGEEHIDGGQRGDVLLFSKQYVAKKLQMLADDMFLPWELSGGVDDDKQVNMVTCSFVTRMRWNSFGIWVHIAGNNATVLRQQVDALGRTARVTRYIKRLVSSGPPFETPLVVYINVMDFPCNVVHPYLNFFTKRGVKGILFPDDQSLFWEHRRGTILNESSSRSFSERNNSIFFLGSPNNKKRMELRDMLESSEFSNQTDITIAVLEHKSFRHLIRPIEDHTRFRYLLSIRGRTASSRDMSFQVMNSTIIRLEDYDTWFQWYHVLWEPFYNYLPLHPSNSTAQMCLIRRTLGFPEQVSDAGRVNVSASRSRSRGRITSKTLFSSRTGTYASNERIASNMGLLGEVLTQEVVDNYARYILRRFAAMQRYTVSPDPVLYVRRMRSFVSKRHRGVQVIPDDSSHVKYVFWKWLARRWKQLLSCRDAGFAKSTNGTRKACTYW